MNLSKILKITKSKNKCYDLTVENNHNFFCNNFLIHNCNYNGEIMAVLINLGQDTFKINKGDKIAQIIFEPCESFTMVQVDDLKHTERGLNGFGSTGISSPDTVQSPNMPIKKKYLDMMRESGAI